EEEVEVEEGGEGGGSRRLCWLLLTHTEAAGEVVGLRLGVRASAQCGQTWEQRGADFPTNSSRAADSRAAGAGGGSAGAGSGQGRRKTRRGAAATLGRSVQQLTLIKALPCWSTLCSLLRQFSEMLSV
ncbi:unnamed protein product, partial [Lampetra planeri]